VEWVKFVFTSQFELWGSHWSRRSGTSRIG
jgi:hypothetical protein